MHAAARYRRLARVRNVGIHQIDGEDGVVLLDRRAQQQRSLSGEAQNELREESRVVMVKPERPAAEFLDVTEAVEDRERIALLQHAGAIVHAARRGQDVELVVDLDDVFGHGLPRYATRRVGCAMSCAYT